MTTKEAIIGRYQEMMANEKTMFARLGELQAQESEFRLVADSIRPLDPGRKCFQMIGGVLVERTVGDVLPIIDNNRDSLTAVLRSETEKLQKQASERMEYQRKYGIQAVPQSMAAQLNAQQQQQQRGDGGEDGESPVPRQAGGPGILA